MAAAGRARTRLFNLRQHNKKVTLAKKVTKSVKVCYRLLFFPPHLCNFIQILFKSFTGNYISNLNLCSLTHIDCHAHVYHKLRLNMCCCFLFGKSAKPPPAKKKKKTVTPASQDSQSVANRLVYLTGIPEDASEQEVTDLVGAFGKINNVILLPCSEESEKGQGQKVRLKCQGVSFLNR